MSRKNRISTALALALAFMTSHAKAEDQVRSYFLNDVPRMKAECRNAGGTWQGSYCSYPKSGGSSESSGGGSFLGALALAVIGGLIYCGANEDNCKSSSSGN